MAIDGTYSSLWRLKEQATAASYQSLGTEILFGEAFRRSEMEVRSHRRRLGAPYRRASRTSRRAGSGPARSLGQP
jgi:hypothetical protein